MYKSANEPGVRAKSARNLNGLMCVKVPFTTAELSSYWLEASIFLYQMIKPTKLLEHITTNLNCLRKKTTKSHETKLHLRKAAHLRNTYPAASIYPDKGPLGNFPLSPMCQSVTAPSTKQS